MSNNIIERAVIPYHLVRNKIIHDSKFHLFAPAAGAGRVGMAGYNPLEFDVDSESIVSLSDEFKNPLLKYVQWDYTNDPDDIKTSGTVYTNFSYSVIDSALGVDTRVVTGSLLVIESNGVVEEFLMADGKLWSRKLKRIGAGIEVRIFRPSNAIPPNEVANKAEAEAGISVTKFMTPLATKQAILNSVTTLSGVATETEAKEGISNDRLMTPLRTKQAMTNYTYDKQTIDDKVSATYRVMGTITFENLLLETKVEGNVYNVIDSFETTEDFVGGEGKTYEGGSNVVVTHDLKFDVLSSDKIHASNVIFEDSDVNTELIKKADKDGTYLDMTVGLAKNLVSSGDVNIDNSFYTRVTAGDSTEIVDGIAKLLELEGSVVIDEDNIVTSVSPIPSKIYSFKNNWCYLEKDYIYDISGIRVLVKDDNTVRVFGTATADLEGVIIPLTFIHSTKTDADFIKYCEVIEGSLTYPKLIEYYATENKMACVGVAPSYLISKDEISPTNNDLKLWLSEDDTIDITFRLWTKHVDLPGNYERPEFEEVNLGVEAFGNAIWFKDNVFDYTTKLATINWERVTIASLVDTIQLESIYGDRYTYRMTSPFKIKGVLSSVYKSKGFVPIIEEEWLLTEIGDIYFDEDYIYVVTSWTTHGEAASNLEGLVWLERLVSRQFEFGQLISNEYIAYNYGLEIGVAGSRAKIAYTGDLKTQIRTNTEYISKLSKEKAKTFVRSVTLFANNWYQEGNFYIQSIGLSNFGQNSTPIIALDTSDSVDGEEVNKARENFSYIFEATTDQLNVIYFKASYEVEVDLKLIIKVVE